MMLIFFFFGLRGFLFFVFEGFFTKMFNGIEIESQRRSN